MVFVLPRCELSDPRRPRRFELGLAPGTQVVRRQDWLTWREANAVLDEAKELAKTIAQEAHEAFERERQRGYEQGLAQARAEQAAHMAEQAARAGHFHERIEAGVADLVLSALSRLVEGLDVRDRAAAIVSNVLQAARQPTRLVLRTAPAQVVAVRHYLEQVQQAGGGVVDVMPDPRLADDACVAECDLGLVEASLSSQLEAIGRVLREAATA